ncbi:MAG: hypothetical protein U0792_04655 [Gemmataceae bacterium]
MKITPFQSVGPLRFGDTRESARAKISAPYSVFRKDVGEEETDSFDSLGLHLYYDREGHLEYVEAFEPLDVTFRGITFLGRDLESVIGEMTALGFVATESAVGVKFFCSRVSLCLLQKGSSKVSLFSAKGITIDPTRRPLCGNLLP